MVDGVLNSLGRMNPGICRNCHNKASGSCALAANAKRYKRISKVGPLTNNLQNVSHSFADLHRYLNVISPAGLLLNKYFDVQVLQGRCCIRQHHPRAKYQNRLPHQKLKDRDGL